MANANQNQQPCYDDLETIEQLLLRSPNLLVAGAQRLTADKDKDTCLYNISRMEKLVDQMTMQCRAARSLWQSITEDELDEIRKPSWTREKLHDAKTGQTVFARRETQEHQHHFSRQPHAT